MDFCFEDRTRSQGYTRIAGVDEAGRGPLAGPVVACACILPENLIIPSLNDSKKLTEKKRAELFKFITDHPDIETHIGICTPAEIDQLNILYASLEAMKRAFEVLRPDYILIDGNKMPKTEVPGEAIIKGDGKSPSIAAASIIAKHTRDQMMLHLHAEYPAYNFAKHKGYPTKEHIDALTLHGPSPIHRLSFAPVRKLKQKKKGEYQCKVHIQ